MEFSSTQKTHRTDDQSRHRPAARLGFAPPSPPAAPPDLPSDEFISQEVDPILDKISAHGLQSLTERERAILQAARAKMSKR